MLHDSRFFLLPEVAPSHIMQGKDSDMAAAGAPLIDADEATLQNEWQVHSQPLLQ